MSKYCDLPQVLTSGHLRTQSPVGGYHVFYQSNVNWRINNSVKFSVNLTAKLEVHVFRTVKLGPHELHIYKNCFENNWNNNNFETFLWKRNFYSWSEIKCFIVQKLQRNCNLIRPRPIRRGSPRVSRRILDEYAKTFCRISTLSYSLYVYASSVTLRVI